MIKKTRKRIATIGWRALSKIRFWWAIHRMTNAKSLQQQTLDLFRRLYPSAKIVQIGANDGVLADPLRKHILASNWTGVLVEPQPEIFEILRRNYSAQTSRLKFERAAITSHDGRVTLHTAPMDNESIRGDSLASLSAGPLQQMLGDKLNSVEVDGLTFESLLSRNDIDRPNLVVIDTEGHDEQIVAGIDFDKYRPELLVYEHIYMTERRRVHVKERLVEFGYECVEEGLDTICVLQPRKDSEQRLAKLHARFQELMHKLLPVSDPWPKPEQGGLLVQLLRFLHSALGEWMGFRLIRHRLWRQTFATPDYRASCPPSAPATKRQLVPENVRLAELRAAYAKIDESVTRHSLWSDGYSLSGMSMQFFRGQSAYVWMYNELPRAMQMKYYVFARYAAARCAEVLRCLEEDGAFGSVCYEFDAFGMVSRDRIDSALEIDFLDRHMGIKSKPDLRVLDIGAGYGRLAHRVSTVCAENLADYCCVDSIPESTFFCEFYVNYRGLSPAVRVEALPDVVQKRSELGKFDIAFNVHSFSECTFEAVEWWIRLVQELEIPYLFIVPNDPVSFLATQPSGEKIDYRHLIEDAGYRLKAQEPLFEDSDVRALVRVQDHLFLFERG